MQERTLIQKLLSCLLGGIAAIAAWQVPVATAAGLAGNFTLPYRGQPGDLSLYDFAGQVILLEFFAAS